VTKKLTPPSPQCLVRPHDACARTRARTGRKTLSCREVVFGRVQAPSMVLIPISVYFRPYSGRKCALAPASASIGTEGESAAG
jgi:hypothetical protein